MISFLKGIVAGKKEDQVLLDVNGIGYEVFMASSSLERLPGEGQPAKVLVVESFGMYGGGATLYGFLDTEEKELFETFRESVPNTGAKKALELLDKAAKSLPDFRRAILEKDARILAGVFGFTKKTADKLILGLKDKVGTMPLSSRTRTYTEGSPVLTQTAQALSSLGYRSTEVKTALAAVQDELAGRQSTVEETIRLALKKL